VLKHDPASNHIIVFGNNSMANGNLTPTISFQDFFALDFRKLPLEVLKTISLRISGEIHHRKVQIGKDNHAVQAAFVGIPINFQDGPKAASSYLKLLLSQDWSHLFTSGSKEKRFYVYAHVKKVSTVLTLNANDLNLKFHGHPFYVGKGCGNRAFDLKRNQGHGAILRELLSEGKKEKDIVHIVKSDMTEDEALELESKLIYFFGTKYEQERSGMLVNLDIPARPTMLPWKKWVEANKEEAKNKD
jgi:hypothetical protein